MTTYAIEVQCPFGQLWLTHPGDEDDGEPAGLPFTSQRELALHYTEDEAQHALDAVVRDYPDNYFCLTACE